VEERQWREGTIVQVYHPGFMGRIGVVLGQEGGKLVVLIDGREVKVEPSKAVPVGGKSRGRTHQAVGAGSG